MNGLELIIIIIGLVAIGWLLKRLYTLRQQSQKVQAKATSLEDEVTRLWTTQSELSGEAKRLQAEVDRITAENRDLKQRNAIIQSFESLSIEQLSSIKSNLDIATHRDQLNNTPDSFLGLGWKKAIHRIECRCK